MKIDTIPQSIAEGYYTCCERFRSMLDMLIQRITFYAESCFGYGEAKQEEKQEENNQVIVEQNNDVFMYKKFSPMQEQSYEINKSLCRMQFKQNELLVTFQDPLPNRETLMSFATLILNTCANDTSIAKLKIQVTRDADYNTLTSTCKIGTFDGSVANQLMERSMSKYTIEIDRSQLPQSHSIKLYPI